MMSSSHRSEDSDSDSSTTSISPSSNNSSNTSSRSHGGSSERRGRDFSITAILSNSTGGGGGGGGRNGGLRGSRSSLNSGSPPSAMSSTPHNVHKSGKTNVPLSTPSRFNSRLYTSPHPSSSSSSSSHLAPSCTSTPISHWIGPLNQSVSLSPFNIGLLMPLSPSPTSGGDHHRDQLDISMASRGTDQEAFSSCNDSLGMLSTVAAYHGEMSGGEGGGGGGGRERTASLSVGDGMARMRLESSSETVETTVSGEDHRTTPPAAVHPSSSTSSSISSHHLTSTTTTTTTSSTVTTNTTTTRTKGRTPCILKRDRKRPRQLADSFPQNQSSSLTSSSVVVASTTSSKHQNLSLPPQPMNITNTPTTTGHLLDPGYLSPTSVSPSTHHQSNLSFSPSIFLSQPARDISVSSSSSIGRSSGGRRRISSIGSYGIEGRGTDVHGHRSRSCSESGVVVGGGRDGGSENSTDHTASTQVSRFATSTPIKQDKENSQSRGLGPSPSSSSSSYLSPGGVGDSGASEAKKLRLRDNTATYYEISSGSDSEPGAPLVISKSRSRAQSIRRQSRARAQLSPLLENACSPIAKTDQQQRPPSSLLTSNLPSSSSSLLPGSGPGVATALPVPLIPSIVPGPSQLPSNNTQHLPSSASFPPSSYIPAPIPPLPFPAYPASIVPPLTSAAAAAAAQQYLHQQQAATAAGLYLGMLPNTGAVSTIGPNSLFPVPISPLSPPNAAPFYAPLVQQQLPAHPATANTTNLQVPCMPLYYGATPQRQVYGAGGGYPPGGMMQPSRAKEAGQKWGSSPLSTQIEKTGHIQSVPPWFIFEQNRPEGKRLRLTEAINRSLSETPAHNPKLPPEWTKYACGQTDDQVKLTQRARAFLQSGRRQLTFDNISSQS